MRLLGSPDVRLTPDDVIFRQSARGPLAITVSSLATTGAVITAAAIGKLPVAMAGFAASGLLLFAAVGAVMLRRASSPANWLIACDGRRVLVKFRSYLNRDFPAELPHVLELTLDELELVQAGRSEIYGQDSSHTTLRERLEHLDIRVNRAVDLTPFRARLDDERGLRSKGGAWRHYPVTLADARTVRIEWRSKHAQIVPAVDQAVQLLGGSAAREPAMAEGTDLGGGGRVLDPAVAMRQLRALARQGRIVEATLLGRRAFGWSTTEARRVVDQAMTDDPAPERDRDL